MAINDKCILQFFQAHINVVFRLGKGLAVVLVMYKSHKTEEMLQITVKIKHAFNALKIHFHNIISKSRKAD